jgi:hypothetical protein
MIYKLYETFIFMVMEEVTEKKCFTCGKVKRLDSFGKNKRNKDGKDGSCKICNNTYQVKKRQERYVYDRTSSAAKMSGLTKRDWCKTYEFLISIGYDCWGFSARLQPLAEVELRSSAFG